MILRVISTTLNELLEFNSSIFIGETGISPYGLWQ
jgi:hypothetical protein